MQESTKTYKQTIKAICGPATFRYKVLNKRKSGLEFESYQVCHNNCVHDYWLGGGSQVELEATRWLTWADIKTMAFQQKVLQFILCCYNILHLQTPVKTKNCLFCAAQYSEVLKTHNNSDLRINKRLTVRKQRVESPEYPQHISEDSKSSAYDKVHFNDHDASCLSDVIIYYTAWEINSNCKTREK